MEVYKLMKKLDNKHKSTHGQPVVKSVLYDILTNVWTLFTEPSWEALITVTVDFASYMVMPLEGGYSAANAHAMYLQDELAYDDGGVTEDFLFVETTNLFKEKFWQFFGLFDRVEETTGIDPNADHNEADEEEEEEFTGPSETVDGTQDR